MKGKVVHFFSASLERFSLLAAFPGLAESQIKRALQYSRKRKQFGRTKFKNQAISHELVDLKMKAEATADVAMAKLAISQAAVDCGFGALYIKGGVGYAGHTG